MTQHQHTPGPWHCGNRDNWWRIYDENGVYIAAAKDPSPAPNHKADGFDIEEANARLIAAAPELLEALEYLVQSKPGTKDFEKWWNFRVAGAHAAIAKAKGE